LPRRGTLAGELSAGRASAVADQRSQAGQDQQAEQEEAENGEFDNDHHTCQVFVI
jgi:hypothetical protein